MYDDIYIYFQKFPRILGRKGNVWFLKSFTEASERTQNENIVEEYINSCFFIQIAIKLERNET